MGDAAPFAEVAPRYDSLYGDKACRAEDRALLRMLAPEVVRYGDRVLDVGCGTGWLLDQHLPIGAYIGFDISPEMIRQATSKHPLHAFQIGDAQGRWLNSRGVMAMNHRMSEEEIAELRRRFLESWGRTVVLPDTGMEVREIDPQFSLVASLWCSASYFSPDHGAEQAWRVLEPGGRAFFMPHAGGSMVEGAVRGDHYMPPACYNGSTGWRPWVSWEAKAAFERHGFVDVEVRGFRANWDLPGWLPQWTHDLSRRFERRVHVDECAFLVLTATKGS